MAKYDFTNLQTLAADRKISTDAFWGYFTQEQLVDMVQLGWMPGKRLIAPAVHRYIVEVVFDRKARLEVFPALKTLS